MSLMATQCGIAGGLFGLWDLMRLKPGKDRAANPSAPWARRQHPGYAI